MKIDPKFDRSFEGYEAVRNHDNWHELLERYVLYGLPPGGFFTSLLANDMMMAASRTHPANQWRGIQETCKWIMHNAPRQCWGSYEAVDKWCKMDAQLRNKICEDAGLKMTPWDILKE